jgi:hypothetical protein
VRPQVQLNTLLVRLREAQPSQFARVYELLADDSAAVRHAVAELVACALEEQGRQLLQVCVWGGGRKAGQQQSSLHRGRRGAEKASFAYKRGEPWEMRQADGGVALLISRARVACQAGVPCVQAAAAPQSAGKRGAARRRSGEGVEGSGAELQLAGLLQVLHLLANPQGEGAEEEDWEEEREALPLEREVVAQVVDALFDRCTQGAQDSIWALLLLLCVCFVPEVDNLQQMWLKGRVPCVRVELFPPPSRYTGCPPCQTGRSF